MEHITQHLVGSGVRRLQPEMQGSESNGRMRVLKEGLSTNLSRISSKVARNYLRSPYMHGINKDMRGYWIPRSVQSASTINTVPYSGRLGYEVSTRSLPRTLSTAMNN